MNENEPDTWRGGEQRGRGVRGISASSPKADAERSDRKETYQQPTADSKHSRREKERDAKSQSYVDRVKICSSCLETHASLDVEPAEGRESRIEVGVSFGSIG